MFRVLASVIIILSAIPAWACPDLAGVYDCESIGGRSDTLVITQSSDGGTTEYTVSGSNLVADNQPRAITGDVTFQNATVRAWCEEGSVKSEISGRYMDGDKVLSEMKLVTELRLDGAQLSETSTGFMQNELGRYPITGERSCVRQ